ncbi:hypothetical protein NL676_017378 [Syzygium grande]|nr:hypothetical protein NL676_017378 [Syzygium grande]
MDFRVVLERPDNRVGHRRRCKSQVKIQHRVPEEDGVKWFLGPGVPRGAVADGGRGLVADIAEDEVAIEVALGDGGAAVEDNRPGAVGDAGPRR